MGMDIAVLGVDLGKNVCSVAGLDASGAGDVRPNFSAVFLAVIASGHEEPVPIFQQLARSDSSGRDDVRAVPTVAAKRRGSLGRARDRHQP